MNGQYASMGLATALRLAPPAGPLTPRRPGTALPPLSLRPRRAGRQKPRRWQLVARQAVLSHVGRQACVGALAAGIC